MGAWQAARHAVTPAADGVRSPTQQETRDRGGRSPRADVESSSTARLYGSDGSLASKVREEAGSGAPPSADNNV